MEDVYSDILYKDSFEGSGISLELHKWIIYGAFLWESKLFS